MSPSQVSSQVTPPQVSSQVTTPPPGPPAVTCPFCPPLTPPTRIACVSAPSVYQKLRQGAAAGRHRASAVLMEYDRRFSVYGDDFVFYDYNDPLSLEARVAPGSFDVVLADPPYLSRDCLEKVSQTIKYLSKGKVVLCTGVCVPATHTLTLVDILRLAHTPLRPLVSRRHHGRRRQGTPGCDSVRLCTQTREEPVK